jgi:hypothetical protein
MRRAARQRRSPRINYKKKRLAFQPSGKVRCVEHREKNFMLRLQNPRHYLSARWLCKRRAVASGPEMPADGERNEWGPRLYRAIPHCPMARGSLT